MRNPMYKFLPFALFAAVVCYWALPLPASAQEEFTFGRDRSQDDGGSGVIYQYDNKYRTQFQNIGGNGTGVLPNYKYGITLLRDHTVPGSKSVILRIFSPGSVTGCIDLTPPRITIAERGPVMRLELEEASLNIDGSARAPHYECGGITSQPHADLILDMAQLEADKTERITLGSKTIGQFATIELDGNDNRLILHIKTKDLTTVGLPLNASSTVLTHWFYPENTVILHVPGIDEEQSEEELHRAVTRFARRNRLIPLEHVLPAFTRPAHAPPGQFYFTDPTQIFYKRLIHSQDQLSAGQIELTESFFSSYGLEKRPVTKTVFAKRPGALD